MLRNRNLPTRVLSAIYRKASKEATEETRWLFVTHPNAMVNEVFIEMKKLPRLRLQRLAQDPNVRQTVKLKAKEMISRL
jgi:hypothetical protein